MSIPINVIANADDLGLSNSVNNAILYCYQKSYINSASFLTNTLYFEETVDLIHENPLLNNIGIHINLAEGKPVSDFNRSSFLDQNGHWDIKKTDRKFISLKNCEKRAFASEIEAQINKALSAKISVIHLDSHHHLHTLPCFYALFLQASKKYKLKLRMAQTFNEGSYLKFLYRKSINYQTKLNKINYSDYFSTVTEFLKKKDSYEKNMIIEIMLHPDFDSSGVLTDHFDKGTMDLWINFLNQRSISKFKI